MNPRIFGQGMDLHNIALTVAGLSVSNRVALFSRRPNTDLSKQYLLKLYLQDRARKEGKTLSGDELDVLTALAHTPPENYKRFVRDLDQVQDLISPSTGTFIPYEVLTDFSGSEEEVKKKTLKYDALKRAVNHLRHDYKFLDYSPIGQSGHGITKDDYRKLIKLIDSVRKFQVMFTDLSDLPDLEKITPTAIVNLLKKRYQDNDDRIWALNEIYRSISRDPRAIMPEFDTSKLREVIAEKTKSYVKKGDPWSVFSSFGGPGQDYKVLKEAMLMPWLQSSIMRVLEQVAVEIRPDRVVKSESPSTVDELNRANTLALIKAVIPIRHEMPYSQLLSEVVKNPAEAYSKGYTTINLEDLSTAADLDRYELDYLKNKFLPVQTAGPSTNFFRALPTVFRNFKGNDLNDQYVPVILRTLKEFLKNPNVITTDSDIVRADEAFNKGIPSSREVLKEGKLVPSADQNDQEIVVRLSRKLDKLKDVDIPAAINAKKRVIFKIPDPSDLVGLVDGSLKKSDLEPKYDGQHLSRLELMANAIKEYKDKPGFIYFIVPSDVKHSVSEVLPSHESEFLRKNPAIASLHRTLKSLLDNAERGLDFPSQYKDTLEKIFKGKKQWFLTDTLNYLKRVGGLAKVPFGYRDIQSPLSIDIQSIANQIDVEKEVTPEGKEILVPYFRQSHIKSRLNDKVAIGPDDYICKEVAELMNGLVSGELDGGYAGIKLKDLIRKKVIDNKTRFTPEDAYKFISSGGLTEFTRDPRLPKSTKAAPKPVIPYDTKLSPIITNVGDNTVKQVVDSYIALNKAVASMSQMLSLEEAFVIYDSTDFAKYLNPYLYSKVVKTSYVIPDDVSNNVAAESKKTLSNLIKNIKSVHDLVKEYAGPDAVNDAVEFKSSLYDITALIGNESLVPLKTDSLAHEAEFLEGHNPTDTSKTYLDRNLSKAAKQHRHPGLRQRLISGGYKEGLDPEIQAAVKEYIKNPKNSDAEKALNYIFNAKKVHVSIRPSMVDEARRVLSTKERFMEAFKHSSSSDPYQYLFELRSIAGQSPDWDNKDFKIDVNDFDIPDFNIIYPDMKTPVDMDPSDRAIPVFDTEIGDLSIQYTLDDEFAHPEEHGSSAKMAEFHSSHPGVYFLSASGYPREIVGMILDQANDSVYGSVFTDRDISRMFEYARKKGYLIDPGELASSLHELVIELGSKSGLTQLSSMSNDDIMKKLRVYEMTIPALKMSAKAITPSSLTIPVWSLGSDALSTILYKLKTYDRKELKPVSSAAEVVDTLSAESFKKVINRFLNFRYKDSGNVRFPELEDILKVTNKLGLAKSRFKKWLATENPFNDVYTREQIMRSAT